MSAELPIGGRIFWIVKNSRGDCYNIGPFPYDWKNEVQNSPTNSLDDTDTNEEFFEDFEEPFLSLFLNRLNRRGGEQ